MSTINRTIETENDRVMAARLIEARAVPFTLSLTDGKHRTTAQNKLQRLWMNEISQQRGDMTPEEARAYCKLTIGVPLLRADNEAFRIRYDEVVKPLPYEQKMAIMMEPLDLPVTRLMTTKQKTDYLDGIARHFAEKGIVLTMPEEMKSGASPAPDVPEVPPASATEPDENPPPSSGLKSPEHELLIRYARDLLPMAAEEGMTMDALKAVEQSWAVDSISTASVGCKEKARAISLSMRAVAKNPSLLPGILKHYADVLECGVEELGGAS